MAIIETLTAENRFATWVDWDGYLKFLEALGDRRVRVTFDRGKLELMTPSSLHERLKTLLARLVEALTEELDIPVVSGGSMTAKRRDVDRGLEPDECYWITSASAVQGVVEIDWAVHPPPDLVIEVDVSRSSVDRIRIYAAFGVPEVWQVGREGAVKVHHLGPDSVYIVVDRSGAFPALPLVEVERHLRMLGTTSDTAIVRSFRSWVRLTLRPLGERRADQ